MFVLGFFLQDDKCGVDTLFSRIGGTRGPSSVVRKYAERKELSKPEQV